MKHLGWNEFEIGSVLFSFNDMVDNVRDVHQESRNYSETNSFQASVAHWRVEKPIFNSEHCINCYFCWIYCPDSSILVRDNEMKGIDYIHCKGCGVCSSVCPTNPKSLIMFDEHVETADAMAGWPQKEEKKKDN